MPEGPAKSSEEWSCGMDLSSRPGSTEACTRKMSEGRMKLMRWLNKQMKIEMSDGRILLGIFLCTDRDGNVILGSCTEYINPEAWGFSDEPRMLGLVMVPGKHIVSVKHDSGTGALGESQRPASAEQPSDSPKLIAGDVRRPAYPVVCSQNPLWDPELSDSPDSDNPKPSPLTKNNSDSSAAPKPDQITLDNLYT